MKISFIKYKKDDESYTIARNLGFPIFEIAEPEEIDQKIEEIKNQNYKTIIIPNELASFSQDIIKKYTYDDSINIIITPSKKRK